MDTGDSYSGIITVIFTLFVASTVNERIIEFIKLYFKNFSLKSVDVREEHHRHRRLWLLTLGVGMITAALMEIDFLSLADSEGVKLKMFRSKGAWFGDGDNVFYSVTGYLFTAFFLSMGSKFWHDLLDIVFFVKRSKAKIGGFNPDGLTSMDQVEEYLEQDDLRIAERALENEGEYLKSYYGDEDVTIFPAYHTLKSKYQVCIYVLIRDDNFVRNSAITKKLHLEYQLSNGYRYRFPILEEFTGEVEALDDGDVVQGGGILYNTASEDNRKGTFGCVVKRLDGNPNEKLLLTCCHCVKTEKHSWKSINKNSGDLDIEFLADEYDTSPSKVGKIFWAYRNHLMDIALIDAVNDNLVTDLRRTSFLTVPRGVREVKIKDARNKTSVWFSGIRTDQGKGHIIYSKVPVSIKYSNETEKHVLYDLIVFSKTRSRPFQKPCGKGDSGAILMESDTDNALGMIVASDRKFGYAIRMTDILNKHKLALFDD
ncbi:MAG: hypothetical protein AAGA77_11565 [Bacteroidota bacterium]